MSKTRTIITLAATVASIAGILIGCTAQATTPKAPDAFAVAAHYGVTVVRDTSLCPVPDPGHFSCFSPATPNTIYVTSEAPASLVQYLVLHQLGHLLENRNGQQQDECLADDFVQINGIDRHPHCIVIQD